MHRENSPVPKKSVNINIFDFDETLFRVPGIACKEAASMTPYEWYDSPGSLNLELNPRAILNTVSAAKNYLDKRYLVTHRVEACKKAVNELLLKNKIEFDGEYFLGRETRKGDTVWEILQENREIKTVRIYEDSLWEIIQYVKTFIEKDPEVTFKYKIEFSFIDKTKVIELDWEAAFTIAQTAKFEKLKII